MVIIGVTCATLVGCKKQTSESVLKQLDEKNYEEFTVNFEKLSEEEKNKVNDKIIKEAEIIVQDFVNSDLKEESYNSAIEKLEQLMPKSCKADKDQIIAKLSELYDISNKNYMAYEEGLKYLNDKEYEKALEKFNEVSMNHPIYEETKKGIDTANIELEKLKPAPVEVIDMRLSKDIINNQIANIQFTNKSDKPIKEIIFSIFAYDVNGYPVKVQFNYDEYLNCKFDLTIQPGETTDGNVGWKLYNEGTEITQLRVSIASVEFYEGDTWKNPIYSADLEKYVGKPLN